jgi:hypothetical protein
MYQTHLPLVLAYREVAAALYKLSEICTPSNLKIKAIAKCM